jgi:hypothetical protein
MMPEHRIHHGAVALSAGGPVVVCMMHIHVMFCKRQWYNARVIPYPCCILLMLAGMGE